MKKNSKKIVYFVLVFFLVAMAAMTIVSRVVNASQIPVVETVIPRGGSLVLDAMGRGVVRFGTVSDTRIKDGSLTEDTYYVEGYFFKKEYVENLEEGSEVLISIGGKTMEGTLAAKTYNYREDTMDVILDLPEGSYTAGAAVEFVREKVKVRYQCCIAKELIYEEENGNCYVYLLQQKDSILGNITVAVKTQLHVIAENTAAAAVEEEFGSDTKIIRKGVALEDGMRVRERE